MITSLLPLHGASAEGIGVNAKEKVINWAYDHHFGESNSPTDSSDSYSQDYMASIYNGLMKRTIASDREHVPVLAASMPVISSDYRNWTFTLRSGLKFSDGSDLNASSVVFSYKVHLTKSIDVGYKVLFPYRAEKPFFTNDSIYEIDNLRIQFNMTRSYAFASSLFSLWIYSKDHFGPQYAACEADIAACDWNTDLTGGNLKGGSGPFMMDKYDTTKDFIELVPNPYFYNAAQIKLDRIVIRTIIDVNDAKAALGSEKINIFDSRYKTKAADFTNFVGVKDVFVGAPSIEEMVPNHNHQYFGLGNYSTPARDAIGSAAYTLGANQSAARNIRKAMSHMIDRAFIVDEVIGGLGTPTATIMPKIAIGWDETILPRVYSPDIAKGYMEDAGFDYTGKTFDAKTGAMNDPFFSITLQEQQDSNRNREQWMLLVIEELPKIGIGVKFRQFGSDGNSIYPRTFTNPVPPPNYENGGYDIFFIGWSFGIDFNPFGMYELEFQNPSCCNVYNYNNATVENAIAAYVGESDAIARLALVKRVQELLHDDLPSIPIFNKMNHWSWANQITGLDGLSMSQGIIEWELVDMDFSIAGVSSPIGSIYKTNVTHIATETIPGEQVTITEWRLPNYNSDLIIKIFFFMGYFVFTQSKFIKKKREAITRNSEIKFVVKFLSVVVIILAGLKLRIKNRINAIITHYIKPKSIIKNVFCQGCENKINREDIFCSECGVKASSNW